MKENRPFIITFIGDGCILSALLLILSLFRNSTDQIKIYSASLVTFHTVPSLSEVCLLLI